MEAVESKRWIKDAAAPTICALGRTPMTTRETWIKSALIRQGNNTVRNVVITGLRGAAHSLATRLVCSDSIIVIAYYMQLDCTFPDSEYLV